MKAPRRSLGTFSLLLLVGFLLLPTIPILGNGSALAKTRTEVQMGDPTDTDEGPVTKKLAASFRRQVTVDPKNTASGLRVRDILFIITQSHYWWF